MDKLRIVCGKYSFDARFEAELAPKTVAVFKKLLPCQMILYPGGISETEILLAYGGVNFASKMGQLAGNHFITITSGLDRLTEMCKGVLWEGAKTIRIEEA